MVTREQKLGTVTYSMLQFDNTLELVNFAKNTKVSTAWEFRRINSEEYETQSNLLLNGWHAKTKELKEAVKALNAKTGTKDRIKYVNEVQGYKPNVPLYLNGVPNCMINMKKTPVKKAKTIHIVYDSSYPWAIKADEVVNNGALLVNVINQLEASGYRVKLDIINTMCNVHDNKVAMYSATFKEYGQPLNLDIVSYPIMNDRYLRCIMFDLQNKNPYEADSSREYISYRGYAMYSMIEGTNRRRALVQKDFCKENAEKMLTDKGIYVSFGDLSRGEAHLYNVLGLSK